tara:strand:+ start:1023 stop:1385 length:363 start_codon:yes stop_codon:yes gene_type:complete
MKLTKSQLKTVIREAINIKLHGADMAYDYKHWAIKDHGAESWKDESALEAYGAHMKMSPCELNDLRTTLGMVKEGITEEKNEYAICTKSVGEKAGTTKRSEWSEATEKKYERCKKEVKDQ